MLHKVLFAATVSCLIAAPALAQPVSPSGAEVYIIELSDGATVDEEFIVKIGLNGTAVAPTLVEWPDTGHHHILIDATWDYPASPIANTPQHLHFGGGQTQKTVKLAPSVHHLQLFLGDHNHVLHSPPVVADPITITIE